MAKYRGTAAQQILQEVLGREWKVDKQWAGQTWDLWNGRDYVAIRLTPGLPTQGQTFLGERTMVLHFWELEALQEPEMVAQIIEKAVLSRSG